jgi:hypothetical protein
MEGNLMKRFLLIMMALISLAFFSSCEKKDLVQTKFGANTVTEKNIQTPKTPLKMDVVRPKSMVSRPLKAVVVPKIETKVNVTPKIEVTPKTEVLPTPKVTPPKYLMPSKSDKVSIIDLWFVPNLSSVAKDLMAITFVVQNPFLKAVKIKVVCYYQDGSLFGESIPQTIDGKSNSKLMVRGLKRCPDGISCQESFNCSIKPVR